MVKHLRTAWMLALMALVALGLWAYKASWHPPKHEPLAVQCQKQAPDLVPGQALKVMTWNLQYLAGTRYVFWYDENHGSDTRPTEADLAHTLDEAVRVIRAERPDVLLLQEVDNGAKASAYQDQLALLRERLADLYPCAAQTYTWKASFVPDRHILGSAGRTLATLSRYRISQAERSALPLPGNAISRLFGPRHAVLTTWLPVQRSTPLAVLNTELDHYRTGDAAQREQLITLLRHIDKLESQGTPWLVGGDFNALPLGQHPLLAPEHRERYSPTNDLHLLWERYPMIPSNAEASGAERQHWLSHRPNGSPQPGPSRTLDYLFHSPALSRLEAQVRQGDTLGISDHLPLIARLLLPDAPVDPEQ
ncbi:endonuclease/exonuclease/phosphatase family protein [Pseudomonas sp. KNUC1026]|uniref:endonuclease/exonuclease/phosphatase family protein n=1 Tax=Pseudomonas sp. KNUC1026 TaxID=2893890 RepID=UPI001F2782EE|nr:endonuclease/exonuclease/phosphatase family protein [Pseudomonas sp. KNUC1026]UFH51751.1 endonuclease/exonuclease/phosphatase family protein [Pseudomonas sp. KNUC1026]